jgi:hypothetical protein
MTKKELWLKIKNYHFDHIVHPSLIDIVIEKFGGTDANTKAFSSKIANKHGWHYWLALAAVKEYKKFIYLGIISNFQVTPSIIIDVVWHEHILFSKAYREFCDVVIEHQFDHYPELLKSDEQSEKYKLQHINTLHLYFKEFGIAPPSRIWGEIDFKLNKDKQLDNGDSSESSVSDHTHENPLHTYFIYDTYSNDYSEFTHDSTLNNEASGSWGEGDSDADSGDGGDGGDGDGGCGGCGGGCG